MDGIKAVQKPAKSAVVHLHDVFSGLRPGEAMLFQALLPETESVSVPGQNLDDRPAAVTKYEQAAGEKIHLQMIGNHDGKSVDRLSHVCGAEHDEYARRGSGQHREPITESSSRRVFLQKPASISRRNSPT